MKKILNTIKKVLLAIAVIFIAVSVINILGEDRFNITYLILAMSTGAFALVVGFMEEVLIYLEIIGINTINNQ